MKKLKNKYESPLLKITAFIFLAVLFVAYSFSSAASVKFSSENIPQNYTVSQKIIFFDSDTVFINDDIQIRDVDYKFDYRTGRFDLSLLKLKHDDSVTVKYTPIPDWVKLKYGRDIPQVSEHNTTVTKPFSYQSRKTESILNKNTVALSGVKTFRFVNQSNGGSEFNQSLDLQLSGKLTESLNLEGNVSDRGYDPVYGTVNSRLNELDKVNLKLYSTDFQLRVGDMLVNSGSLYASQNKKISGVDVNVQKSNWSVEGTAARSKGRFETAVFYGIDNRQGPYQINSDSRYGSVIPLSETVWLDGKELERGADKDYVMDYPAGTITFNNQYPIDRRRRIEIDYEPLLTTYRSEYFKTASGFSFLDSSLQLNVGWVREGDTKGEQLSDAYRSSDEAILSAAGDVASVIRSSVEPDSLGAYILIIDSLPDTVYQFVGDSSGTYNIRFSYVGEGSGQYNYAGGDNYYYVGDNNGSYSPVIILTPPRRYDYYNSRLTYSSELLGDVETIYLHNLYDANLYSDIDDNDNGSDFYRLSYKRSFDKDQRNSLKFRYSHKDESFQNRQRLFPSDLRQDYMIPAAESIQSKIDLAEMESSLSPINQLIIQPAYSKYKSVNNFKSDRYDLKMSYEYSQRLKIGFGLRRINTNYMSGRSGKGEYYSAALYTNPLIGLIFESELETDNRTNNYQSDDRQTKYYKSTTSLKHNLVSLTYEYYHEDSTSQSIRNITERNRLNLISQRKIGRYNYSVLFTYQNVVFNHVTDNSLLSRFKLQYYHIDKKLNWSSEYSLSEESRRSRGIRYVEVNPGEGDYILEDGQYISDPAGNYIRLEEILSDQSRVARGLKSFQLNKTWSKARFSFESDIEEELLPEGKRNVLWLIPFYSDDSQPYFYYNRNYRSSLRFIPISGGYAVSLLLDFNQESRTIVSVSRERREWQSEALFRQLSGKLAFEEKIGYFNKTRDSYYNGGGSGRIKGYSIEPTLHYLFESSDWSIGGLYRSADDGLGGDSKIYALLLGSRVPFLKRGEINNTVEFYSQDLNQAGTSESYLLTGNRPGSRGVIWSTRFDYALRKGLRFNINIRGRHADNRTARITGRGELVASF